MLKKITSFVKRKPIAKPVELTLEEAKEIINGFACAHNEGQMDDPKMIRSVVRKLEKVYPGLLGPSDYLRRVV